MLYITSTPILIQSIFRVSEFSAWKNGALMKKEVFIYLFDSVLMWSLNVYFDLRHPGDMVRKKKGVWSDDASLPLT